MSQSDSSCSQVVCFERQSHQFLNCCFTAIEFVHIYFREDFVTKLEVCWTCILHPIIQTEKFLLKTACNLDGNIIKLAEKYGNKNIVLDLRLWCFNHAKTPHNRANVLPVPVGLSSRQFSFLVHPCITFEKINTN